VSIFNLLWQRLRNLAFPSRSTPRRTRRGRSSSHHAGRRLRLETCESRLLMAGDLPILMVISNNDFYYKEYADPRAEFEAAGIPVVVAAGQRFLSTPHANTGQGASSGAVMPDLTLDQANAADYSAIVFVGGYGANQYQFAFPGVYNNALYNSTPAIRSRANQLINDFVAQDKIVAGVCNGANVLAWARVGGQSLVQGRTTATAHFTVASNNLPQATLYRWHQETNGATTYTGGSLGNPSITDDDVVIDGRIITAVDQDSARQFGITIVEQLQDTVTLPVISATTSDGQAFESGGNTGTITIARAGSTTAALVVNYSLAGSANSGDYAPLGSTVLLGPGQASTTLTIQPQDDSLEEAIETVILNVGASPAYTVGAANSAAVTITDNDQVLQFAQTSGSVTEAAGTVSLLVTLSSPAQTTISIPFTLSGTATATLDYTNTGTINIAPGQTSAAIPLVLVDDNVRELSETVIATLGTSVHARLGSNTSFQLTIADNDPVPLVDLSTSTVSFSENGGAVLTASLTNPSAQTIVIDLAFSGTATPGIDYTANSSQISIPPGQTAGSVVLAGLADLSNEPTESIVVEITSVAGAQERDDQRVTLSLLNDTTPPPDVAFAAAGASVNEMAGTVTIPVLLTTPSPTTVILPFTIGGTATSADRTVSSSPLTIPAGQTSAAIVVNVINDALDELNESVTLTLGTPTNATLGPTTTHTLTIVDNDASPLVQFTAMAQNALESAGAVRAIVRLAQPSGLDVTVPVTVGGTASAADASVSTILPVVIPAGQTSAAVDVSIVNDALAEPTETLVLALGSPTNGTLGAVNTHTVTIVDNDSGVSVQLAAAAMTVHEAGGSFPVFVTMSSLAPTEVVVPLNFAGSATSADYNVSNQEVRIPAGQTRGIFTIRVTDDQLDELAETIVVSLGTPNGGASVGSSNSTTITIDDNDPVVSFARGSDTVADSNSTITVIAQTGSPVVEAISIPFAIYGSASNPTDYTLSANQFNFALGASTAAVTITIHGDGIIEPLEFVTLRLTPPANASLGSSKQYTLFLADADTPVAPGLDLNGPASGQDFLSPAADFVEDAVAVTLVPAATVVPPGVQTLTSITAFLETAPNGVAESLAATGSGGATVTPYNATTRTLTINGGSASDQQAVLRSLTYLNSAQNPTAGGRFVSVTSTFSASSETRRRKLTVTPQNDAPTVTLSGGSTNYVTGNSAVTIDGNATISDVDSTMLTSVVVTLTDADSGDVLSYTPRGGLSYSLVGNTLTIGGLAGVSYYAGALQLVRFSTTTVGDGTRTVSIAARDFSGVSGVPNATTTVNKSLTVQSPLLLAESSVAVVPVVERLTAVQLQPLVTEALARWEAAGLGASQLAVLRAATIEIRDLQDTRTLGLGGGSTIILDDNAAGAGWYVDANPTTDDEFAATIDRVDLLTVIMHEHGHLLGLDDIQGGPTGSLMSETLSTSVRRVPTVAALHTYFSQLGS
jgi:putative intracellular protease/amidase